MIYIETNEENKIIFTHYMPFDEKHGFKNEDGTIKTKEQLESEKKNAYVIEGLPKVDKKPTQGAIFYYTPDKGVWFELFDIPQRDYPQVDQYWVNKIQDDMTLALIEAGVL